MKNVRNVLLAGIVLATGSARADDIDIYLDATPGEPHVLLVLDMGDPTFAPACPSVLACAPPHMSQRAFEKLEEGRDGEDGGAVSWLEVFRAVLASVIERQGLESLQLAIVASNAEEGATILSGYRPAGDGALAVLDAIPAAPGSHVAHQFGAVEAYYEWYRYLTGGGIVFGRATAGNFAGAGGPGLDPGVVAGERYVAPFTDRDACVPLYSILLALREPPAEEDGAVDHLIRDDPALPAGGFADLAAMWDYLHSPETDLLAAVAGPQPLLRSWVVTTGDGTGPNRPLATAGGSTAPLAIGEPARLERTLGALFHRIVQTSSTFVANTVPLRRAGTMDAPNNLYVSLFEARAQVSWPGNVKKLKLAADPGAPGQPVNAVDARGRPAFEAVGEDRGRIAFEALTFWTDSARLSPAGADPAVPDGADGRVVMRGGAGQKIPGYIAGSAVRIGDRNSAVTRNLFVEPPLVTNGARNALVPFDATAETLQRADYLPAALDVATNDEALEMIRWARGLDVDDADSDGDMTEARPWLMGDVLHSRPLALNYGATPGYSATNPNIRLFFGSGAGVFHIIEDTAPGGAESGRERYAFLPRAVLGVVPLKRANRDPASLMRYGVDGSPVALVRDLNRDGNLVAAEGDEVLVYFGLRRGGTSYYALDASDPASPPVLLWTISPATDEAFDALGLTFSEPVVGRVQFGGEALDVVIFAGGYHGGRDAASGTRLGKDAGDGDDPVGNAIYMVDARSGELVWRAVQGATTGGSSNREYRHSALVDSIPSTVAALRDARGLIHRLYVGDTGGVIWRVDLPPGSAPDHRKENWFISRLADLGSDGAATDRRFFHPPDLVSAVDADGVPFDGILVGSGDRAHPGESSVDNFLFYLRDYMVDSGNPAAQTRDVLQVDDLPDRTRCLDGSGPVCTASVSTGWKIALEAQGEKSLSSPLTESGRAYFSSFVPASDPAGCTPSEGSGRLYVVNLSDGSAAGDSPRFFELGPGMPAGPVALDDVVLLPGGGIATGPAGQQAPASRFLPALGERLLRIYWREPGIDAL